MIKNITFKRLCITTLLLLVSVIIYNYPEELTKHISEEQIVVKRTIYLIDADDFIAMSEYSSKVNTSLDRVKEIITTLTIGSGATINGDLQPILPKDTKLLEASLQEGLLKVNFNKTLLTISKELEEKMLESLIFSLTSIEEVEKVMIFVEGNHLEELPHSHKKLDLYLDRSYGINKIDDITTFYDTKRVTLYYQKKNYYVPVSLLVNDENDKVNIIINRLKGNSLNYSNLSTQLNYQLELTNYSINENDITLSFNDVLLDSVYDGVLKEEVKYAIFYSLHDTLGIKDVSFYAEDVLIDQFGLAKS